jgi:uncharacterized lipoprotein YehR (DUF1307 family)
MTNKKILMVMLALALIFGMTVVGCGGDDDSTGNNNQNGNDGYKSGDRTVKASSTGQLTFKVQGLTISVTTNIPNNTKFTLSTSSPEKVITGLTPSTEYIFSFTTTVRNTAFSNENGVVIFYEF